MCERCDKTYAEGRAKLRYTGGEVGYTVQGWLIRLADGTFYQRGDKPGTPLPGYALFTQATAAVEQILDSNPGAKPVKATRTFTEITKVLEV